MNSSTGNTNMAKVLLKVLLLLAPTTPPPTSAPVDRPARLEIEALIAKLSSRSFAERQAAQEKLKSLGESATAVVIQHLPNPDDDVARRLVDLIGKPHDIALRVDAAARLIETTDPDWMERGVQLLFEDPTAACGLFTEKSARVEGRARALFGPIAEQLQRSKSRHELFQAKLEKWRKQDPENAARMVVMERESDLYDADAAYWSAIEALDDWENGHNQTTSAPMQGDATKERPKDGPGQTHPSTRQPPGRRPASSRPADSQEGP
ncbi:MAG TPA: hypothetical protein VMV81_04235 [Phycisphaerae bacterium]|nr:hypothetical protein [Phycisphaerae bacterium]